jgi:hypothetical protein
MRERAGHSDNYHNDTRDDGATDDHAADNYNTLLAKPPTSGKGTFARALFL